MKSTTTAGILATTALLAHGAEVAEAQRKLIEQKMVGTDDPMTFYDGKLVFDLQERLRVELRDNNFDFNDSVNVATDDTWLLHRFRLGAMVKPAQWFKAYVQGQDAREFESERKSVPYVAGSEGDDPFDLRQAYLEFGDPAKFPLTAKVGRQELIYGDERLIGAIDWSNFSRTFDAAKLRYDAPDQKFRVDVFAAHVVEIRGHGPSENRGWTFDDASWQDTLGGIYASTTLTPKQTTDLYFLYRNKKNDGPLYLDGLGNTARPYDIKQEVYTAGARVKSLPGTLAGFDYEAEAAYQFGRNQGRIGLAYPNTSGTSLDHEAYAFEARAGHTWENVKWKPRLGLEYSFASGNTDPNDDKDESFLNLFPTNHKFYGYMDFFAWKNIHNPVASLKFAPAPKLTVQLDGHGFWLASNEDAWYRANGVAQVRPFSPAAAEAETFVGTELDLTVGYTVHRALKFLFGYSHFFAGPYLQDTGSSDDADFAYAQMIIGF